MPPPTTPTEPPPAFDLAAWAGFLRADLRGLRDLLREARGVWATMPPSPAAARLLALMGRIEQAAATAAATLDRMPEPAAPGAELSALALELGLEPDRLGLDAGDAGLGG